MPIRTLLAAAVAAALAPVSHAADTDTLDTIFIKTQRDYSAAATETVRDYSTPTSTVGTKIPATLRDIPQSISIITNQQVKDRSVETLDQLARKTPGLRVLSNDDGRSSIYARGYEYDEYNVDGLPAPMQSINGTLPNLAAFDRVEIMRGPSGLFDSSGEMGGIVNLVRKRPTADFKASVNAGFGSDKQYKAGGDIGGSLNRDGSLRGRVLAETVGKSAKPAKTNNHHETAYAALDWDITADTTAGVGYLYQTRHLSPDNGLPAYADGSLLKLPEKTFAGAKWNKFSMQSHDVFADLSHYFANNAFGKIGVRYSDRSADFNYAFPGSALKADNTTTPTGLGGSIDQSAITADASYSQPFRWGNMQNEYVVGADYNHFKTTTDQGRARSLGGNIDYRSFSTLNSTFSATRVAAHAATPSATAKKPWTKPDSTAKSPSAPSTASPSSAAAASATTKSRTVTAATAKNATKPALPATRAPCGISAKTTASTPPTPNSTVRKARSVPTTNSSKHAKATKSKSATKAATWMTA